MQPLHLYAIHSYNTRFKLFKNVRFSRYLSDIEFIYTRTFRLNMLLLWQIGYNILNVFAHLINSFYLMSNREFNIQWRNFKAGKKNV